MNVALSVIGAEFSMSAVSLSWIATDYFLAAAVFHLPFGRLADIHGCKKIYTYGIVIYSLSALLLASSRSELELICYRLIEGFGAAMVFGIIALLTSVFPPGERARLWASSSPWPGELSLLISSQEAGIDNSLVVDSME